jgi:hypothetical protein
MPIVLVIVSPFSLAVRKLQVCLWLRIEKTSIAALLNFWMRKVLPRFYRAQLDITWKALPVDNNPSFISTATYTLTASSNFDPIFVRSFVLLTSYFQPRSPRALHFAVHQVFLTHHESTGLESFPSF